MACVGIDAEAGVIDEDYRGEVMVLLHNVTAKAVTIQHGSRIAQLLVIPVVQDDVVEVSSLDETERGDCGFGSTGK